MPLNLNDHVRVTLTDYGFKVWRDYHAKLGLTPSPDVRIMMPLWELMFVFGPTLVLGSLLHAVPQQRDRG